MVNDDALAVLANEEELAQLDASSEEENDSSEAAVSIRDQSSLFN